jgi:hypothetical protein
MSPPTCTRCGAPITADASFCGQCGAVVAGSEAPPTPPPSSVAQTAPSRVPPPRRGLPILPLLILVVGVLAVAAALLLVPRREPPAGEALLGSSGSTLPPVVDGGLSLPTAPLPAGALPIMPTPTPKPWVVPTELPPPTPTPTPPLVAVFRARQAARFDVSPEDAEVTVDGRSIGKADDWDDKGGGKLYRFDGPGSHYVKLSLKGYRTAWIKIVVSGSASDKVAEVDTELKEDGGKGDDKDKKSRKAKDQDEDT